MSGIGMKMNFHNYVIEKSKREKKNRISMIN